jgi:hypothetical protein
VYKL